MRLFWIGLQLLLIGLKLGGALDWSWWWVGSPFLLSIALAATALAVHVVRYTLDPTYRMRVLLEQYARAMEGK